MSRCYFCYWNAYKDDGEVLCTNPNITPNFDTEYMENCSEFIGEVNDKGFMEIIDEITKQARTLTFDEARKIRDMIYEIKEDREIEDFNPYMKRRE